MEEKKITEISEEKALASEKSEAKEATPKPETNAHTGKGMSAKKKTDSKPEASALPSSYEKRKASSGIRGRVKRARSANADGSRRAMSSPDKLEILVTVINRQKTEFYIDLLHNFEINLQLVLNGRGTATSSITSMLGLADSDKSVIFSIIRKDKVKDALGTLEDKFTSVRNGKGVAYTIPMSSVIGVAIYQFISNKSGGGII